MDESTKKNELEDLGYNAFFESGRKASVSTDLPVARVTAELKGWYRITGTFGESLAKITTKHMRDATEREDFPAVGDWVVFTDQEKDRPVIQGILPRKTILKKKRANRQGFQVIAANVDVIFIVASIDRDFNLNRFERYFILAREGNITPAIVLNKVDLIPEAELASMVRQIKDRFSETDVIETSTVTENGLKELISKIERGKTYCFLGSSGVGKSSLINRLLKSDNIKTTEVSRSTGRGKHTTTGRDMYFMENGGIVIDNPGMREVMIAEEASGMEETFAEIAELAGSCKYSDCTHTHEPGCAVIKAVEDKQLDAQRYDNYKKMKTEIEFNEMSPVEKKNKDRQFGKFVKKAKEEIKQYD